MSTKTYILQAHSRQWPLKKVGDTIELAPAAAKYLVHAGVLAEPIQERQLAEGEVLAAAPLPEGSAATDLGPAEAPSTGKRRKGED